MSTITFYRQARRDGGVRTGIEIDNDTVLARFERGGQESDPALVWYVDVRLQGKRLPTDPEAARSWLLRHGKSVARILRQMADEVPLGIDPGDWPLRKTGRVDASGVKVTVSCSAMRRVDAQSISNELRDIAQHWDKRVAELPEIQR